MPSKSNLSRVIDAIVANSNAKEFPKCLDEWVAGGFIDLKEAKGTCRCGNIGCRYLFTIYNQHTDASLDDIGSKCVQLLNHKPIAEDAHMLKRSHNTEAVRRSRARNRRKHLMQKRDKLQASLVEGTLTPEQSKRVLRSLVRIQVELGLPKTGEQQEC